MGEESYIALHSPVEGFGSVMALSWEQPVPPPLQGPHPFVSDKLKEFQKTREGMVGTVPLAWGVAGSEETVSRSLHV